MNRLFVDRNFEIRALEEEWKRKGSSFAIIYGRRRVGKTEIVRKFIEGKRGIYYLAGRIGYRKNMQDFQREAERCCLENFSKMVFDSWDDMFSVLCKMKNREKMVIVIDEFPNMADDRVLSEFQKAWDLHLQDCNVFLILVGSSITMMQKLTLDYHSPLYGRRTMQMRIEKMKFWDAMKFMPHLDFLEFLRIYAVTDGIPYYIMQMNPSMSVDENIKVNVLSKDKVLYEEAEFLLRMELREFRNYFPILEAIASGKRSFGEISNATGMNSAPLSNYLKNLKEIGVIREDEPVFGKRRSRRYRLSDNYFAFWFGFVHPNRNQLELGHVDNVWKSEKERFNIYVGQVFEDVVRDLFSRNFSGYNVGKWWNRMGDEIDLVAFNKSEKIVYLGEIKLGKPLGKNDLNRLMEKATLMKIPYDYKKKYVLVAPTVKVSDENVLSWDFQKLRKMLREV